VHPLAEIAIASLTAGRNEAMRSVTLFERIGGWTLSNKTP
jgi:hypothetical protein